MKTDRKSSRGGLSPNVPAPRAIGREASHNLHEALQDLKAKDEPDLDGACKRIRYTLDLLKALEF